MLETDVLSTQSTSDPDVVNGISESIVYVYTGWDRDKELLGESWEVKVSC